MTIYSNGPEAVLEPPMFAPPLTQPLIRPVPAHGGVRVYRYAEAAFPADGSDMLFVTASGHWYRMDDEQDPQRPMPCRGCGAAEATYADVDALGRCPKAPSQQDIVRALMESVPRSAPARMRDRSIRFIRTAVAA
jgi:hypothetical protein